MGQVLQGVNNKEQLKITYWNKEPEGCPPGFGLLAKAKPEFYLRFEKSFDEFCALSTAGVIYGSLISICNWQNFARLCCSVEFLRFQMQVISFFQPFTFCR